MSKTTTPTTTDSLRTNRAIAKAFTAGFHRWPTGPDYCANCGFAPCLTPPEKFQHACTEIGMPHPLTAKRVEEQAFQDMVDELTPSQRRDMLVFLTGGHPHAVAAALAFVSRPRRPTSQPASTGPGSEPK